MRACVIVRREWSGGGGGNWSQRAAFHMNGGGGGGGGNWSQRAAFHMNGGGGGGPPPPPPPKPMLDPGLSYTPTSTV